MKTPALRLTLAVLVGAALVIFVIWQRGRPPLTPISSSSPSAPGVSSAAQNGVRSSPAVPPVHLTRLRESPPRPEPAPPKGVAKVTLGAREITPASRFAHFERIKIAPGQDIPVEVAWPEDKTSTEVLAHALDGGTIDRATNARRLPLTPGEAVKFTYHAGHQAGLYQVLLRRGTQEEVLEFWVPTPHPENDPPALN